jgi:hypothetical protein
MGRGVAYACVACDLDFGIVGEEKDARQGENEG